METPIPTEDSQAGIKRNAEANRLITQSQDLFAQRKSSEAIQLLRKAYELDKNNSLARSILANALVEHANSIVETDWWEAETLTNEALGLNPTHPTAKTINSLILDRKTGGSIEDWVTQTQKLQSAGNLSAALSQIAEGLTVFPHEPKLLQLQDAIQRDHSTQRRQARRRDLEDLRSTASEVDAVADVTARKALAERIKALTAKYSTDGEILSIANALLLRLGQVGVAQKHSTESPESETATRIERAPIPVAPEVLRAATSQVPPTWTPPENARKAKVTPNVIPKNLHRPADVPPTPTVPSKSQPCVVSTEIVAADIAAADKVPTALQEKLPARQDAPALEHSPPAAKIASPSVTSISPQPEQPVRSNSTRMILAVAAAMIIVAAISYSAGEHHAPTKATPPAIAPAVASPTVSAPAVSSETNSAPGASPSTVSVPAAAAADSEPSQPVSDAPSDIRPEKTTIADQPAHRQQAKPVFSLKPNLQPTPQPKPQPQLASLTIQGGTPDTKIFVDQNLVGTVQSDGSLSISTINPGDHLVELRKDHFKSRQFNKHFVAGGTLSLAAADSTLEAAPGELQITFTPPDASVAIVKGDLLKIVSSGVPLNVPAGIYTLTARTAEKFTRSSTFEIAAGQSKILDLPLAPNGMSKWNEPGAWKHEGDSFLRTGGDFVLYGDTSAPGTFLFSAMITKGHFLQWVLNYIDSKNYVLFQIDDKNFYRTVIRNGEKSNEVIVPDRGDKKSFRTLQIRVSPTELVHQIKQGDRWTVLDRCTQPHANLSLGKFGFYIPGNDEVSLSGFAHYVDLNIR